MCGEGQGRVMKSMESRGGRWKGGHSMTSGPKKMKFNTTPPQICMKVGTKGACAQKTRF